MASNASRMMLRHIAVGLVAAFTTGQILAQSSDSKSNDLQDELVEIDQVDLVMLKDPLFEKPVFSVVRSDAPIELWMKALARPEPELQRVAIDTFARAHHRQMEGVDVVVDPLVSLLQVEDQDADVRRAAVRALIEFDQDEQDKLLAELVTKHGNAIAPIVEPALARWKSDAMAETWLGRLESRSANRQSMIHAIQGVAQLGLQDASESLRNLVADSSRPPAVRLEAAEALGRLNESGLDQMAQQFVDRKASGLIADLIAVKLLSRHQSADTLNSLTTLAKRAETTVQAAALGRLFEIDPEQLLPHADENIDSADVNVRRLIARALIHRIESREDASQDTKYVQQVASLLDDVNPSLRKEMAVELTRLAKDSDLKETVIEQTVIVLSRDAWRGCEQATIVLVNLDHQPASQRFVQLIRHDRGEVMVTAGWGLRRFALKKHLPQMLDRAKEIYQGFKANEVSLADQGPEELMTQLFMAFGEMRFQPANELMRAYIPKQFDLGENARSAAAWAMGYLHEDKNPTDLAKQLEGRLLDQDAQFPEFDQVRRMAAISLGRMDAQSTIPSLRKFTDRDFSSVSLGCEWSIERMTGEKAAAPSQPTPFRFTDWFLMPYEASKD